MQKKGFGLIGILIVVAIIAGIGAFTFDSLFPDKSPFTPSEEEKSAIDMAEQAKQMMEQKNNNTMPPADTTQDETKDWKTYRNEEYGFEFKYPIAWEFNEPEVDKFDLNNEVVHTVDLYADEFPVASFSTEFVEDIRIQIAKFSLKQKLEEERDFYREEILSGELKEENFSTVTLRGIHFSFYNYEKSRQVADEHIYMLDLGEYTLVINFNSDSGPAKRYDNEELSMASSEADFKKFLLSFSATGKIPGH